MASELYQAIYAQVRKIPKGFVSTYGAIARVVGCTPRVVGYALHQNKDPEYTPCHRVVFKDGSLTPGYVFGGEPVQRQKLIQEGIRFGSDQRVETNQMLWF